MSRNPPSARPGPAIAPGPKARADGLATAAIIVGILAFLTGVLPVLGLILGAVGVALGMLARRRSNRAELGLTALILSSVAVLTNIVVDVIVVISIVTQANNLPG